MKISQTENEIPIINVEFDTIITADEKISIKLYETRNKEQVIYNGEIKRRGGFSNSLPKHSYEIDLDEDVSIASLPEDDDWILNANYIDKTFLRHVLSYELFSLMNETNITSKTQYIELELNGEYNGLYVLMEKLDKSSLNLKGSDSMAVIFKEPHIFRETYDGVTPQYSNNFHQQTYPKVEQTDKGFYLEEIRKLILNQNDNFESCITDILDINNIIDWHILLLISNNSDGILKNFYLYKIDRNTPFRIAPWDYDHSFGRDGDNQLNLNERPMNIERSILFKRLLEYDWYKTSLKERWIELNSQDLLSASGLKQRIFSKSDMIKEHARKNFKKWPLDNSWYYDSNDFDKEIKIMIAFIDLRHNQLSEYFDNL